MSLAEYKKKRNFSKTTEPKNKKRAPRTSGIKSFVIQEHHASSLHYDFRLEEKVSGPEIVLVSWAVPKNLPFEPGIKRLAIRTEDHPLEYLNFKGTIPEGEYGAGTVDIWDKGTWKKQKGSLDEGHLDIELAGKKISGSFTMVRTKGYGKKPQSSGIGSSWLIWKKNNIIKERSL